MLVFDLKQVLWGLLSPQDERRVCNDENADRYPDREKSNNMMFPHQSATEVAGLGEGNKAGVH
ncbi:hypothetical protein B4916_21895 [Yersinia intermedia]|nr:hypothetical protein B4916_21895 [Yersinia intermedia]